MESYNVYDNTNDNTYNIPRIVDLLNEQQATISKQLDQIIELQDKYRILEFNHSRLEKRNKAQYEKIGEQQATITHLEEECKEKLDTFDKAEIEAINIIYKEKGFDGVIEYSRQKLYSYGVVKEKNGLVMMATGGWSDNEDYLYCLNHLLSNFGRNHYVGYLRGGAFYYSKDKYNVRTEIVVIDENWLI